jgi:homoserine kinase type II
VNLQPRSPDIFFPLHGCPVQPLPMKAPAAMAVYTEVSDEDLARFIASYDAGELISYKGIAEGVENTNYLVHTSKGNFILTLYEKRVAASDLPFFLGLMEHLAQHGVTCPTPLRNAQGQNVSKVAGRAAALVTFLDGFWLRRPRAEHCGAVGRALAELHVAGRDFPLKRPNALGLEGWRPLFQRFATDADDVFPRLAAMIEGELSHLENVWPQGLESGVIHADLFPDNVFFLNDKLSGLIDFYFACNDAFAYDVAICLNAWCFEPDYQFNLTKGRALLAGYNSIRPMPEAERAALPTLARGAAMRFLLTRSYDWLNRPADALVQPHNPVDYVHRLRFHQSVSSPSAYGLDKPS